MPFTKFFELPPEIGLEMYTCKDLYNLILVSTSKEHRRLIFITLKSRLHTNEHTQAQIVFFEKLIMLKNSADTFLQYGLPDLDKDENDALTSFINESLHSQNTTFIHQLAGNLLLNKNSYIDLSHLLNGSNFFENPSLNINYIGIVALFFAASDSIQRKKIIKKIFSFIFLACQHLKTLIPLLDSEVCENIFLKLLSTQTNRRPALHHMEEICFLLAKKIKHTSFNRLTHLILLQKNGYSSYFHVFVSALASQPNLEQNLYNLLIKNLIETFEWWNGFPAQVIEALGKIGARLYDVKEKREEICQILNDFALKNRETAPSVSIILSNIALQNPHEQNRIQQQHLRELQMLTLQLSHEKNENWDKFTQGAISLISNEVYCPKTEFDLIMSKLLVTIKNTQEMDFKKELLEILMHVAWKNCSKSQHKQVKELLTPFLKESEDSTICFFAARVLGSIACQIDYPQAHLREIVNVLIIGLKHSNDNIKEKVADILGKIALLPQWEEASLNKIVNEIFQSPPKIYSNLSYLPIYLKRKLPSANYNLEEEPFMTDTVKIFESSISKKEIFRRNSIRKLFYPLKEYSLNYHATELVVDQGQLRYLVNDLNRALSVGASTEQLIRLLEDFLTLSRASNRLPAICTLSFFPKDYFFPSQKPILQLIQALRDLPISSNQLKL